MKVVSTIMFVYFFVLTFSPSCQKNEAPTKPPATILPDTTSHDFTWQIEILGDGNSSRLNDVCIIDENDIWTVGRICVQDSTGEFINPPFNLAHWNGEKWELMSIKFKYYYGLIYADAKGIYAFDRENVVVSSGGSIMHWDGSSWKGFPYLFNLSSSIGNIYSIWGKSANDFYGVGLAGSIVHYNGSSWQKIESGTELDIQDIWGGIDPITGEEIILAVAGNIYTTYDKEILKINGTTVEKLTTEGIDWPLDALWFDPGRIYYVVGAGIYSKELLDNEAGWNGPGLTATSYSSYAIRGNHIHDVFVTGAYGDVLHFNGNSWRSYREHTALSAGSYRAVAVKGDLMFAVGSEYDKAVILRGKRK